MRLMLSVFIALSAMLSLALSLSAQDTDSRHTYQPGRWQAEVDREYFVEPSDEAGTAVFGGFVTETIITTDVRYILQTITGTMYPTKSMWIRVYKVADKNQDATLRLFKHILREFRRNDVVNEISVTQQSNYVAWSFLDYMLHTDNDHTGEVTNTFKRVTHRLPSTCDPICRNFVILTYYDAVITFYYENDKRGFDGTYEAVAQIFVNVFLDPKPYEVSMPIVRN